MTQAAFAFVCPSFGHSLAIRRALFCYHLYGNKRRENQWITIPAS
nr:MAG TPA: hypothetical protein [Caudoviricetes sp.]